VALFVVELRRVAQVRLKVLRASLLRNLGQVRRVIGTFSKQCVAVDAIVVVPDILAMRDRWRDVPRICQLRELPVAVDGQRHKYKRGDRGRPEREKSCLPFVQLSSSALDADGGPILDADIARVYDADGHQHKYDVTERFQCSMHDRSLNTNRICLRRREDMRNRCVGALVPPASIAGGCGIRYR
jgi:hypothetical protein